MNIGVVEFFVFALMKRGVAEVDVRKRVWLFDLKGFVVCLCVL